MSHNKIPSTCSGEITIEPSSPTTTEEQSVASIEQQQLQLDGQNQENFLEANNEDLKSCNSSTLEKSEMEKSMPSQMALLNDDDELSSSDGVVPTQGDSSSIGSAAIQPQVENESKQSSKVVSFAVTETMNESIDKKEDVEELKKVMKKSQLKHFLSRLMLTIAYFVIMFSFGASQSIVGPCLAFLTVNVGQTSSTIGWIFTMKGLGSITGVLFGGKILDIIVEQLTNFRGFCYEWKKKRQFKKDPNSIDPLKDGEKELEKIKALPLFKKYIARNYVMHFYLASCVMILVASLVVTPFVRDFGLLLFVYFVFGLGSGLTVMLGNVLCAWLWGHYAGTALLLNSAIIGLGAFLCPIILNGFIASDSKTTVTTSTNNSTSSSPFEFPILTQQYDSIIMSTFDNSTLNNSTNIDAIVNGNWRFTYVIIAGVLLASIVIILPIFQIFLSKFELFRLHGTVSVDEIQEQQWKEKIESSTPKKQQDIELKEPPFSPASSEMIPSKSTADFLEKEAEREKQEELQEREIETTMMFGRVLSRIVHWYHKLRTYRAFVLLSLGFFLSFGIESAMGGLIYIYLINYVGTTDISQASLMVSIFYLSMTIGRLVSGIFSYFLQKVFKYTQILVLAFSYVLLISGIIVMLAIPQNSIVGSWIGVVIIGVSICTFIPGYIAYPTATAMRDVRLSGFLVSFLFVFSSIGEMIIPLIITNSFSWFGFHSFFWIILIVSLLMGLITIWLFSMSLELRARAFSLVARMNKQ